ncbi:hypothetical protein FisN_21Hh227 [Fistulifera solaris]|jgi:hypothetical protein|uniref:Uncharacterized protein n=1 Tax=Fistulifera solaris TaxID=1519565 RepID=A0A1Z5JS50_FISSO|nr:hypothetical protein FisN_21Hh227 [Fistulifera solaris]|eukprot:GAX16779.1 hypothetical protein FisN_21Hh227 [Fistulifera solaris]
MLRLAAKRKGMKTYRRKKLLFTAAAAALSTHAHAFVVSPPLSPRTDVVSYHSLQSRRFSSSQEEGILGGLKKMAKKVLPSSWFQSEQEKKAAIERKRVNDEFKGGLQEMLKDAPLPIRMVGSMVAPMLSSAMSGLAETMAEQQQAVSNVQEDAKAYLLADPAVARLLGDGPIQLGAPFSQSSSTSSINGKTTSQVEIAFPVQGSMASGIVRASSANGTLQQLILQASGASIAVSLSSRTPRASSFRSGKANNKGKDDIIEAEIIDKNTQR